MLGRQPQWAELISHTFLDAPLQLGSSSQESTVASPWAHFSGLIPGTSARLCLIEGAVDVTLDFYQAVGGTLSLALRDCRGPERAGTHLSCFSKGTWNPGELPVGLGLRWVEIASNILTLPGITPLSDITIRAMHL